MPSRLFHKTIPLTRDAYSIFYAFKDDPRVFFLDSSLSQPQSKFSYIGFSPITTFEGKGLDVLKKEFRKRQSIDSSLNLPSGAVGVLGYDGSFSFGFYEAMICMDHQSQKLTVTALSRRRLDEILKQIESPLEKIALFKCFKGKLEFKSNMSKAGYLKACRQALEHIRRGDIYQINLSHKIEVSLPRWRQYTSAANIYGALREFFPSDFGAYLDCGSQIILSASPEEFLQLRGCKALVKPMKGTRPRGKTKEQDQRLKKELSQSPKEIAELLMITDLERNDLGKVCDYGSVKVKALRTIEEYASVFQATSTVEGQLRQDCDAFDLLQATFPSGSVTGCPKIEAMKIIKKLEKGSRGLYTGALGYISDSGSMDFNVMIRTMYLTRDKITFHVGSGIVADSKPQAEWQETWVKARAMMDALKKAFNQ